MNQSISNEPDFNNRDSKFNVSTASRLPKISMTR